MIEIDGSIGGGQVIRTVIGLCALIKKPVKIFNIRKGKRDTKPGLRPQHLTAVKTIGEFCQADIKGLEEGSLEIVFIPKELRVKDKKIDIGTAGSISLLLQALTPLLIFNKKTVALEIIGGTETKWSPTIQYIKYVTYPLLSKMGINLDLRVLEHGYYPKGGGRVIVETKPTKKLDPFVCLERGNVKNIHINSVCGNLPSHVAERQGKSALRTIQYYSSNIKTLMTYKSVKSLSSGSSITCYSICENSILGGSALGERGIGAEKIGEMAAEELLLSLKTNTSLDKYMADQILVYLALTDGKSHIKVEEITNHCRTNIQVIEQILPVMFNIDEQKKEISVEGTGFKP